MFWFAWSGQYNSVHWIVPTIAGVFLSASILLIFVGYLNYLTDSYLMFAASALAANTVCRSAAGAAAPLFTQYMFDALGVGGGGSLIGGVAFLLAPIPFIFYKYGESIRKRSKFAPTPEKNEGQEAPQPAPRSSEETSSEDGSRNEGTRSRSDSTYVTEGRADRVGRPEDLREVDVTSLNGNKEKGDKEEFGTGSSSFVLDKDLEKGEP